MTYYLTANAYAARLQRQMVEAEKAAAKVIPDDGMAPLIDRLKRLIDGLPTEVKYQAHPIEFYAERLRGRQRQTPHRGELARCLRQLGYIHKRNWRKSANGFRATWMPPKGSR